MMVRKIADHFEIGSSCSAAVPADCTLVHTSGILLTGGTCWFDFSRFSACCRQPALRSRRGRRRIQPGGRLEAIIGSSVGQNAELAACVDALSKQVVDLTRQLAERSKSKDGEKRGGE